MNIEELAPVVRLADPDGIRVYLSQTPELGDVIPRAVEVARKHFPEAQLILDVYKDPEIPDMEDTYLVLYVRLKNYASLSIRRLEEAMAELAHLLRGRRGWIHLTTDFREPEGDGR
jgi:hypothetical protein